jgi:hypothetical protein
MRLALENMPNAIIAAGVLQNIAIDKNLPDFDYDFDDNQPDPLENQLMGLNINTYRNVIAENFFS